MAHVDPPDGLKFKKSELSWEHKSKFNAIQLRTLAMIGMFID